MSIRDPFTERFSSLPSKPLSLFAVPKSITSVFPFLRFVIVILLYYILLYRYSLYSLKFVISEPGGEPVLMSSLRLCWIASKSFEDVKITESSA